VGKSSVQAELPRLRPFLEQPDVHTHWALWDLYAHQPCLRTLAGHGDTVLALAAAPEGGLVASASHDRSVRIWDWKAGRTQSLAQGFDSVLVGVGFARGGARLVAAGIDGSLRCLETGTGTEAWRAQADLGGELWSLCSAVGGEVLAVSGASGRVQLVNVADGSLGARLQGCASGSRGLALDAAGAHLAVGGADGSLRLYELPALREPATLLERGPALVALAFDRAGRLAVADASGALSIWDTGTRARVADLPRSGGSLRSLLFSSAGDRLLATTQAGVELWEITSGRQLLPENLRREPAYSACFAPDAGRIVTGTADGSIREWEPAATGLCRPLDWSTPAGTLLAFSRLTPRVAYMDEGGGIVVRDVSDGRQLGRLAEPGGWIEALSFDRSAERLVGVSQKGTLRAWRWRTGEIEFEQDLGRRATSMRPSPDGSILVCALDDGRIQVRDAVSGALLRMLAPSEGLCERVTVSLDGSRIASTHHGNLIRLWDARSGRLLGELGARRPVFSVLFARDGRALVVGAWDGSIDVWDLATRARLSTLEGHSQRVNSLTLGADGSLFASASNDGTVRLWDVGVAHCLATFDAGHGPVRNAVFAPDGTRLVAFHDDGSLEEWDLGCYDRHIAGNEAAQRARLQRGSER